MKVPIENQSQKIILLFDGLCNLCSSSVQFILKYNKKENIFFASLQSDFAKEILSQYKCNKEIDSIVLVEKNQIYVKSSAIFQISKHLCYPFKVVYFFRFLPSFLCNCVYDFIARYRYFLLGKKKECMIPKKEWKHRFLA